MKKMSYLVGLVALAGLVSGGAFAVPGVKTLDTIREVTKGENPLTAAKNAELGGTSNKLKKTVKNAKTADSVNTGEAVVKSITGSSEVVQMEKTEGGLLKRDTENLGLKRSKTKVVGIDSGAKTGGDTIVSPEAVYGDLKAGLAEADLSPAARVELNAKLDDMNDKGLLSGFSKIPCRFENEVQYRNLLRLLSATTEEEFHRIHARLVKKGDMEGIDGLRKKCSTSTCNIGDVNSKADDLNAKCLGGRWAA